MAVRVSLTSRPQSRFCQREILPTGQSRNQGAQHAQTFLVFPRFQTPFGDASYEAPASIFIASSREFCDPESFRSRLLPLIRAK